jgi:hypothetical protein
MQLFNHYWYFTKALSEKFCDRVIDLGKKSKQRSCFNWTRNFKITQKVKNYLKKI